MEGLIDFAVLASGSGTNLQAMLDTPELEGKIKLVVSDNPGAMALERAGAAGIESAVVSWAGHESRESFSSALVQVIGESGAEAIVFAGFMRIISPQAVDAYRDRIINVHPSLLPAFPGVDAVGQALAHGVKVTGVTVHIVDDKVDHGPIIAQVAVPILAGDDRASLHERIQVEEHRILPEVVAAFTSGQIKVEQGRTFWR